jgi:hypothetical protein
MAASNKKSGPRNFTNLLDDVAVQPASPVGGVSAPPKKGPLLTFHIDEDLKPMLDRVVYARGRKSSQRAVINEALRALLLADPASQRPIPDED